ncbi:O-antigen ligase family protein [Acinetobacter sp. ANC 4282]|uniref:O-antigen ligase family protein n=1 Tax=Acinetobacter terrae TaxID=2731247 RepID=UPI00148F61A5|nr:O-antigen ligase family protein [Acinetobacter terrae]NNH14822.1 O-antigen ligase family protein [Acinetobacter terrae]
MLNLIKNKELFIALYFLIFNLGFSVHISSNFYNEARLLEIFLLLSLGIFSGFVKNIVFHKIEYIFLLFFIFSIFFLKNQPFIFFEILLFYLLFKAFFALNYNSKISKAIILLSFLIFLMFPVSILHYLNSGLYQNWYPMPWNIRIYNSYFLIFSIFAIWFYLKEDKYKNIYLIFIFLAFLSILLDGGRSATLAYTIFIVIVCIFNRLERFKLLLIYCSTWLAYFSIVYFSSQSASTLRSITRESTSGRYELWLNAFQCWLENPILGCGFYQLDKYPSLSAHPHNLFVQILTETGLIGFIFLSFIIFKVVKNISWNFKQNYFVLAALFSVAIELSFSGIHIYPVTQVALLWLFVFLLKNPEFSHASYFNYLKIKNSKIDKLIQLFIYLFILIIFIYLFINTSVLSENLPSTPPRFWEYGYQLF